MAANATFFNGYQEPEEANNNDFTFLDQNSADQVDVTSLEALLRNATDAPPSLAPPEECPTLEDLTFYEQPRTPRPAFKEPSSHPQNSPVFKRKTSSETSGARKRHKSQLNTSQDIEAVIFSKKQELELADAEYNKEIQRVIALLPLIGGSDLYEPTVKSAAIISLNKLIAESVWDHTVKVTEYCPDLVKNLSDLTDQVNDVGALFAIINLLTLVANSSLRFVISGSNDRYLMKIFKKTRNCGFADIVDKSTKLLELIK